MPSFWWFAANQSKIRQKLPKACYQKMITLIDGGKSLFHVNFRYTLSIFQHFYFFFLRDTGITIRISRYQFFTELGSFFIMMVIGLYNDNLILEVYR